MSTTSRAAIAIFAFFRKSRTSAISALLLASVFRTRSSCLGTYKALMSNCTLSPGVCPVLARFLLDLSLLEVLRTFHLAHQFERAVARFSRHHQLDLQLVVAAFRRLDGNHVQPGRHHPLQVFEHPRPGERLAQEQIVEKLGAVAGAAIGRQIEDLFRFGFLLIAGGNLLLGAVRSGRDLSAPPTHPESAL